MHIIDIDNLGEVWMHVLVIRDWSALLRLYLIGCVIGLQGVKMLNKINLSGLSEQGLSNDRRYW